MKTTYAVTVRRYTSEHGSKETFSLETTRRTEAKRVFMQHAQQHIREPDMTVDLIRVTGPNSGVILAAKYRRGGQVCLEPGYFA